MSFLQVVFACLIALTVAQTNSNQNQENQTAAFIYNFCTSAGFNKLFSGSGNDTMSNINNYLAPDVYVKWNQLFYLNGRNNVSSVLDGFFSQIDYISSVLVNSIIDQNYQVCSIEIVRSYIPSGSCSANNNSGTNNSGNNNSGNNNSGNNNSGSGNSGSSNSGSGNSGSGNSGSGNSGSGNSGSGNSGSGNSGSGNSGSGNSGSNNSGSSSGGCIVSGVSTVRITWNNKGQLQVWDEITSLTPGSIDCLNQQYQ